VDLDTLIVATYCLIDDALPGALSDRPLRRRGPAPTLDDAEVLTLEVVGAFLGLDQDKAIFDYFRRHYGAWFPALLHIHRTTFTRQAANLWAVKERLWRGFAARVPHDPAVSLVDSFPVPVCRFARAKRCRLYPGAATYGYDAGARQTFYGFRCHVRLAWPGVIAELSLLPADISDLAALPSLVADAVGYVVGDRNYWAPDLTRWLQPRDLCLLAPYRWASRDPDPDRSRALSPIRYRIETIFGQLVRRYHAKQVWARDPWHLASRLLRLVLSHTLALLLNTRAGNPPRQLARLLI
jgi:hypothetical protein